MLVIFFSIYNAEFPFLLQNDESDKNVDRKKKEKGHVIFLCYHFTLSLHYKFNMSNVCK